MQAIREITQLMGALNTVADTTKTFAARQGNGDLELPEQLVTRLEDLVAFSIGLVRTDDPVVAISLVLLYARTHCEKSFFKILKKFFSSMFIDGQSGKTMYDQAMDMLCEGRSVSREVMQTQAGDFRAGGMREALTGLRTSPISEVLKHCLNVMVILGVAPERADTMLGKTIYDFVNFKTKSFATGLDVLDSLFYTIDWITARLAPAVTTGDFSLLVDDSELSEINRSWIQINKWVDATARGQFSLVSNEAGIKEELELVYLIEECALAHSVFKSMGKNSPMNAELVANRIIKLNKMALDLTAIMHSKPIRPKPFGILVYGESGVNKSNVVTIINKHLCSANGFRCDKNSVYHANGDDKYNSEFRSSHVTFIFDDMCNTRNEHADGNPLMKIIQFLNNMHVCALSPEAEKKGKLRVMCKLGFVTTNNEDLGAPFFSVNPGSIWRRFERIIGVELREEAIDISTGLPKSEYLGQSVPDMWVFTLKKCVIKRSSGGDKDVVTREVTHSNLDIHNLLLILKKESMDHFSAQNKLVETMTALANEPVCEHHYPQSECVHCLGLFKPRPLITNRLQPPIVLPEKMETQSGISGFDWSKLFRIRNTKGFDEMPEEFADASEVEDGEFISVQSPYERLLELTKDYGDMISHHKSILSGAAAIIGAIAGAWILFGRLRKLAPQGGVMSLGDRRPFDAVDSKPVDFWKKVVVDESKFPEASRTTPYSTFEEKMWKNLSIIKKRTIIEGEPIGLVEYAQTLPMGGGDWLVPAHMFDDASCYEVTVDMRDSAQSSVGLKQFTERVDRFCWSRIPNSDLMIMRLHRGGCNADFTKFLALTKPSGGENVKLYGKRCQQSMVIPFSEPSVLQPPKRFKFSDTPTYIGCHYTLPFETFKGLCGGLIVQMGKFPCILGIHTAGSTYDEFLGGMCPVTLDEVIAAKSKIDPFVQRYCAQSEIQSSEYGVEYGLSKDIHYKNPLQFLSEDTAEEGFCMSVLGQTTLPVHRFTSDVIRAEHSPVVERVMKLPCEVTRPPTSKSYLHYQRDVREMASGGRGSPQPYILALARRDMERTFDRLLEAHPEIKDMVAPISYEQAVNGIDNYLGIDRIDVSTSVGLPISKPKKQFMQRIDSDEHQVAYDFIADKLDVRTRVAEILDALDSGFRVNTIFDAHLKDEAISFKKYDAHKVRLFSGSQVAFVVAYRMIFSPLFAMKRRYPLAFESAVGCNAAGKDWNVFHDFFKWKDRMVNGDYKAFDKTTQPQYTMTVYAYYCYMLEKCGCSERHLRIARNMATEVANPIYNICGAFVEICGSQPSGVPGTVDGNNDNNRLSLRCVYYMLHDKDARPPPLFCDRVRLLCYGDDNIMSVSPEECKFHHTSLQEGLGKIGWTYTTADKESESVPFIPLSKCELLKRSFVYHDGVEAVVGPLQKGSIAKSLHMTKSKTPLCQGEQLAMVAQGALAEFFLHGRDEFEMRKMQLQEVFREMDEKYNPRPSDFMRWPTFDDFIHRYASTHAICDLYPEGPNMRAEAGVLQGESRRLELSQCTYMYVALSNVARGHKLDMRKYRTENHTSILHWILMMDVIKADLVVAVQEHRTRLMARGEALSQLCSEIRMLAFNEGQAIKVHCRGSDRHGNLRLTVGERAMMVRQTYIKVCKMSKAWMILQVHNSSLSELLGRDAFTRVLESIEPSYEFVSASEFYELGGYAAQAELFEYNYDLDAFGVPI